MGELVLLSGGLDSAVCFGMAVCAGRMPSALFVDYGQPAVAEEMHAARSLCKRFETELAVVNIRGLPSVGLLDPNYRSNPSGVRHSAYTPARNLALIAVAASHAEATKNDTISIGACAEDNYPDTSETFIATANALLGIATNKPLSLIAPLRSVEKRKVYKLAVKYGIDPKETWSCYYPKTAGNPCGRCTPCLARRFVESTEAER